MACRLTRRYPALARPLRKRAGGKPSPSLYLSPVHQSSTIFFFSLRPPARRGKGDCLNLSLLIVHHQSLLLLCFHHPMTMILLAFATGAIMVVDVIVIAVVIFVIVVIVILSISFSLFLYCTYYIIIYILCIVPRPDPDKNARNPGSLPNTYIHIVIYCTANIPVYCPVLPPSPPTLRPNPHAIPLINLESP